MFLGKKTLQGRVYREDGRVQVGLWSNAAFPQSLLCWPRSFSKITRLPSALYSTRDINARISITPRPQASCRRSGQVGSGTERGSKPQPSSVISTRTRSGENLATHPHALVRGLSVAMTDGVDQSLFHGQIDAEDVALPPLLEFELIEQFLHHPAADRGVAGNHIVVSPNPVLGHGQKIFVASASPPLLKRRCSVRVVSAKRTPRRPPRRP